MTARAGWYVVSASGAHPPYPPPRGIGRVVVTPQPGRVAIDLGSDRGALLFRYGVPLRLGWHEARALPGHACAGRWRRWGWR